MDDLTTGVPVAIHLETQATQDGDTANYALDVDGQLVQMGDAFYLRYKEVSDATTEPIPVTIKLAANGDVVLTRSAENRLRLHFSNGKRIQARYRTPMGVLPVETVTPMLQVRLRERPFSGAVNIDYELYAGEQLIGQYKLRLQFTA
ncbi:DUF1934 domain-containing protein [Lactiplantibacillus sp. WILCCON 0030]|uniref:DUF1934 domain-containing protein n=1 Tax=Lactiplantibacillus brownii TaxID=3069269 RepID=A0ABU1A629_9LACO|nr:DUF1934 domain-containing protein [Lactiplantibacillus brownii]MDQ7936416.1 DUF1934 domain-containing protein [Lactiplantibacillus brownii]